MDRQASRGVFRDIVIGMMGAALYDALAAAGRIIQVAWSFMEQVMHLLT